jgi:hypothetical protein
MGSLHLFDSPPSATKDVARLRLQVRQLTLSELETKEIVEWNQDADIVRKGQRFYEVWDGMF